MDKFMDKKTNHMRRRCIHRQRGGREPRRYCQYSMCRDFKKCYPDGITKPPLGLRLGNQYYISEAQQP